MLLAFHKPWGVLSRFGRDTPGQRSLADFGLPPTVWPIGRLDRDSEGLLLLSDEPALNARLLDPERAHPRTYWVQVEGVPDRSALRALAGGVLVQGRRTRSCRVRRLRPEPALPPRDPPIRVRRYIPTCWLELELTEGRNRQVRRMTAAVGHPTLRLVRVRIGRLALGDLPSGAWMKLGAEGRARALGTDTYRGGARPAGRGRPGGARRRQPPRRTST